MDRLPNPLSYSSVAGTRSGCTVVYVGTKQCSSRYDYQRILNVAQL